MNNADLISRSALFKAWDALDKTQDPNLLVDMKRHDHFLTCDKCDARVGCTKYAGSSFYIACPFFEHKQCGTNEHPQD